MRNSAFEKWKPFSTVLPPSGIRPPPEVTVGVLASAHAVLVRVGMSRLLRNVQDVGVGSVRLRRAIGGRQPADAPSRLRERTLVLDLYAPALGDIAVALEPRALGELLGTWIPERVEEGHIVGHPEPLVQDNRFERAVSFPFLEKAEPGIDRFAELRDSRAAGIEQVHPVERAQLGPADAAAERDPGPGYRRAEQRERERVAVRVGRGAEVCGGGHDTVGRWIGR